MKIQIKGLVTSDTGEQVFKGGKGGNEEIKFRKIGVLVDGDKIPLDIGVPLDYIIELKKDAEIECDLRNDGKKLSLKVAREK